MFLVTARQMQDMDKQTITSFGIPGRVLMENAGKGAFEFLLETLNPSPNHRVAVLAGRGNNGGDGFVIARYLLEKKIPVSVFLLSAKEKVTGDAKANMDLFQTLCEKSSLGSLTQLPDADTFTQYRSKLLHCDFFVDAVLGTGLNSDVRGFFKDAIELMNGSSAPVFSVDIPSGLHSDTGLPLGLCVKADATATFAFAKTGHLLYPGNTYTGKLKIIDIGIPHFIAKEKKLALSVLEKKQIAALFQPRSFNSHKGSYGHLLVIAGSPGKTGAAALCANAAMRCGTGLVTLGAAKGVNKRLEPMVIEPMTVPLPEKEKGVLSDDCLDSVLDLLKNKQAIALGPGMGTREKTRKLVLKLITKSRVPIVIDADGLNHLAHDLSVLKKTKAPVILTPHPGEMARLCKKTSKEVQADRLGIASEFARTHQVILILKGAQTLISFPDGRTALCPTGNPGMASGGMGDVLTGMVAGFCAQGFSPEDAALAGVYIHGLCGDLLSRSTGAFGFLASDMVDILPTAIHDHLLPGRLP